MRAKEFISELNMAPGNLAKFASSPAATNVRAGFEAELIFPGSRSEGGELDLDQDNTLPRSLDWKDIREFFQLSSASRALNRLESSYDEYLTGKQDEYIDDQFEERKAEKHEYDPDLDDDELRELVTDELTDDFFQSRDYPTLYDYLNEEDIHTWSDLGDEFNLDWPYYTTADSQEAYDLSKSLSKVVGSKVEVLDGYHSEQKQPGIWYVEEDSSIEPDDDDHFGLEVVSPAMPLMIMLDQLKKTLDWAAFMEGATNESTGLHVGVSFVGQTMAQVDYIKLALFLGDKYVLEQFDRLANTYTASTVNAVYGKVDKYTPEMLANYVVGLKKGMATEVSKAIIASNNDKYVSINMHENYVEFRSMGGDYLSRFGEIKAMVLRYVRALAVSMDPAAERQEYLKKLSLVLNPGNDDRLSAFIEFSAGKINKEVLARQIEIARRADAETRDYNEYQARNQTNKEFKLQKELPKWRVWNYNNQMWTVTAINAEEATRIAVSQHPEFYPGGARRTERANA